MGIARMSNMHMHMHMHMHTCTYNMFTYIHVMFTCTNMIIPGGPAKSATTSGARGAAPLCLKPT
jgi:hypothetical protein